MIYLAAYLATNDGHWLAQYEKYIDEALDKTLLVAGEEGHVLARKMPCYSLYQANASLELIMSYEKNAVRRTKIFPSMRAFADVAEKRAAPCIGKPERTHYGMCWDGELALTMLMAPGKRSVSTLQPFLAQTIQRYDLASAGVCRAAHVMAAYWRARVVGTLR